MKRESVNTFSGGLTYDINPITTPNNVLTDGVNATFLTFNGDEMALQNDAGNTKIISSYGDLNKEPYNEDEDEDKIYYKNDLVVYDGKLYYCKEDGVVGVAGEFDTSKWAKVTDSIKLSDGFKPIGLKEHGGILYIVSHRKDGESDEFEIGSYPSPGHRKAAVTTDTTAVKIVEKVEPVEPVEEFDVVHRLGEFIQLSNLEMFPGDPYKIKFTIPKETPDEAPKEITDYLTMGGTRKFYTFKFYLKPKEGDFIVLKDIKTVDSLTPFYSDGVAFMPNNGSGKLFIKFELEDIDEFTQYTKIDKDNYYFPRLAFVGEDTFIEFDYFDVKHGSEIKLDAIEMKYTLINSQTGVATEGVPIEFPNILPKEGEFECKDAGENVFRVQTPNTTQILEYTFTPKNKYYNILFNNHIIKNSIDLSIDPLLWGNRLTYSEEEKGNFYFQSPDSGDWQIFKNTGYAGGVARGGITLNYTEWLTQDIGRYFGEKTVILDNYRSISCVFNNLDNLPWYSGASQKINYTPPFNYKDFTKYASVYQKMYTNFDYRRAAFEEYSTVKYELIDEDGYWIEPSWWAATMGGEFDSMSNGADYAIFLDENDNIVQVRSRTLPEVGWSSGSPNLRYGYYLGRGTSSEGEKYLKVNGVKVKSEVLGPPDNFSYSFDTYGGEDLLVNSIELVHYSSSGTTTTESYVGSFSLRQSVNIYNKGKEITLMKKATDNFDGVFKATTYDFKEAILNNSENLIEPLNLTTRQSNIVSGGRAQVRYVLNNGSTTKAIPALTAGQKYTLAFYLIAEEPSSINVKILGNEYTINYTSDGATLQATVEGGPYKQTHNHEEVNGLYINKIPTLYNGRYYSYVKYTFDYALSGNLVISTSDAFEIAELTLKQGIIIPQAVRVYKDMLHGKIHPDFKPFMYHLTEDEVDKNILGKLYIPNTNYEIRGVL